MILLIIKTNQGLHKLISYEITKLGLKNYKELMELTDEIPTVSCHKLCILK